MSLVIGAESPPLRIDGGGTIRVGASRVTLDTVVTAYKVGESPETIADSYPSVPLADIFAVITYYLRHRDEVEAYLAEGELIAERVRRECEARFPQAGLKEELLARRAAKSDS